MLPNLPHQLQCPEDDAIEGILFEYDKTPHVIPRWPQSERMTLVAVIVDGFNQEEETEAEAFVITDPEQANGLVTFDYSVPLAIIFFTIPKRRALQMCPDLSDDDWVSYTPGE